MSTPARTDTHEGEGAVARSRAPLRSVPATGDLSPPASALQFSESVRRVVELARRGGLTAPVFRSPPRLDGVDRTIRRGRRSTVVAIRRSGRPLSAVQADVIEGVIAANGLTCARADRFRRVAWQRLDPSGAPVAPPPRRADDAPRRVA